MEVHKLIALLGTLLALVAGCTTDGLTGGESSIAGIVTVDEGASPATSSDLVVLWNVTSGSPDSAYIAGTGGMTEAGFDIELPSSLPNDALNQYGSFRLGVGLIIAFEDGNAPAPGLVSDEVADEIGGAITGATSRFAVIYRDGTDSDLEIEEGFDWPLAFPQGFSCGRGVNAPEGETFDSYVPVSCDLVELRMGDIGEFDFVNWT